MVGDRLDYKCERVYQYSGVDIVKSIYIVECIANKQMVALAPRFCLKQSKGTT